MYTLSWNKIRRLRLLYNLFQVVTGRALTLWCQEHFDNSSEYQGTLYFQRRKWVGICGKLAIWWIAWLIKQDTFRLVRDTLVLNRVFDVILVIYLVLGILLYDVHNWYISYTGILSFIFFIQTSLTARILEILVENSWVVILFPCVSSPLRYK